jgi:hypothetical protein
MDTRISVADLARLIAVEQHRIYTLEEVADLTHVSLSRLKRLVRAEKVHHFREGDTRGMTLAQIDLLIASRSGGQTDVSAIAKLPEADPLEEAREASRGNARRGTRTSGKAA